MLVLAEETIQSSTIQPGRIASWCEENTIAVFELLLLYLLLLQEFIQFPSFTCIAEGLCNAEHTFDRVDDNWSSHPVREAAAKVELQGVLSVEGIVSCRKGQQRTSVIWLL